MSSKKTVLKTCLHCSHHFYVEPRRTDTAKYCSRSCLARGYPRDPSRWPVVKKACERCGVEYTTKTSHATRRRFCSKQCFYADKKERHLETRSCANCGKPFEIVRYSDVMNCSVECGQDIQRNKLEPAWHKTPDGYLAGGINRGKGQKLILMHRWVMEQSLGRELETFETVHHKNGVRDDNRLDNLEVWIHRPHKGQRVEDTIIWAIAYLERHGYTITKPAA